MQEASSPPEGEPAARWFEKAVTYKVSAIAMIVAGAVLAYLGNSWIYPTFIPFLVAWILCFFLGLLMSKVVRDRTWISQKQAAVIFVMLVVISYLPVALYMEGFANTLAFPVMAALQGIGTAIGFHMPWLYGGKTSHADVQGIDELMSAMSGREK